MCIWMFMGICVGMLFCDLSPHAMKEGCPKEKVIY